MESTTTREHPSTDHALRVLVRIDTQRREACLEVRGCLTSATFSTLMNILAHTGTLGAEVRVNLLRAAHVERDALEALRFGPGRGAAGAAPVDILAPPDLPVCRLGPISSALSDPRSAERHAMTNDEAIDLAFLRRDPRALAAERPPGPRRLQRGGRDLQA